MNKSAARSSEMHSNSAQNSLQFVRKTLDQRINTQSTAPAIRSQAQRLKTPPGNLEDLSPLLDMLLHHSKAVGLSGMKKYYAQHIAAASSSALPPCLAKSLYDESTDASDLSAVLLAFEKHINPDYVIQQALDMKDKDFCLQLSSNNLQLKRDHRFYTQIQTPIFVTQSNHCDLVVWTEHDFSVVRVFPDQEFWEPRLQKAQDFFKKVCLPELAAKYYSKDMQPHVPGEREQ
ncbi:Endospore coat-associated protein YheD [Labeo rohita]|uniref:Endospore coat-associated protein YheD n=1 Tax=Labeo rohita TaxID=84645 RepID=A0ABQ8LD28_LABRO|nr:Endospore coat-associated protein YheD [Labeo rohita]